MMSHRCRAWTGSEQRSVVQDHPVREREAEGHDEWREHGEWGCFSSRCDELPERTEAWLGVVRFQARALRR